MVLLINNQQRLIPIKRNEKLLLRRTVQVTLATEEDRKPALIKPSSLEVSLLITDDREIASLNRKYRDKDKPTDVLSFPLFTADELIPPSSPLGDIVISMDRALDQACQYNHSLERELAFLVAHGLLHLIGYDHELGKKAEKAMFKRQKEILATLGL